jgi:hypothetical protein
VTVLKIKTKIKEHVPPEFSGGILKVDLEFWK